MSILIGISDFVGIKAISSNSHEVAYIQQFMDTIESKWLLNLLGKTDRDALLLEALGNSGVPTSANYLAIYGEIQLTNHCSDWEVYSSGMKDMLINVVYAKWYNFKNLQGTTMGLKKLNSTNADNPAGANFKLKNDVNLAVNNYRVIQKYIYQNCADYPDFNGINKNYTTPF